MSRTPMKLILTQEVSGLGGPELDRRRIEVRDPIKTVGTHQVRVRLHPEVSAPVDIEITAD